MYSAVKKSALVLLVISALAASAVSYGIPLPSQVSAKCGDVNSDGRLNVFDLLFLLTHIIKSQPYAPAADLDNNAEVDIYDFVLLLNLLYNTERQPDELEFEMVWGRLVMADSMHIFENPKDCFEDLTPFWDKMPFFLYCNQEVQGFNLVFGNDTLNSTIDSVGHFYDPDTLDGENIRQQGGTLVTSIPWHLHLRITDGSTVDSSGITQIEIQFCVAIDSYTPITSREIGFPLTLNDYPQRFSVLPDDSVIRDTVVVDLNPGKEECVIYPDIDSLVTAIRLNQVSLLGWNYFEVTPALDYKSNKKVNRLVFQGRGRLDLKSLDGNDELLAKLGFPAWLPKDLVYP